MRRVAVDCAALLVVESVEFEVAMAGSVGVAWAAATVARALSVEAADWVAEVEGETGRRSPIEPSSAVREIGQFAADVHS